MFFGMPKSNNISAMNSEQLASQNHYDSETYIDADLLLN